MAITSATCDTKHDALTLETGNDPLNVPRKGVVGTRLGAFRVRLGSSSAILLDVGNYNNGESVFGSRRQRAVPTQNRAVRPEGEQKTHQGGL